jgi:hypothetical protein
MCEDYRASLGIDRQHDDVDVAAEHPLSSPVLVVWATRDDMERLYGDPVRVWRRWAADVTGAPIASGHHIAEELPRSWLRRLPASCALDRAGCRSGKSSGGLVTQPDSGLFFQQRNGEEFSADWPVAAQGMLVDALHNRRQLMGNVVVTRQSGHARQFLAAAVELEGCQVVSVEECV